MSLHPARDEAQARKKREEIELCGKNRGSHDYIPIEWKTLQVDGGMPGDNVKRVTRLICRVCFNNVNMSTLIDMYRDISSEVAQNHDTSG
jgi:hypothetical protein